jgi:retron-type reverse transcriptase
MPEAKPYAISKQLVWEAYQRVRANRGAAGVDGESLAAFEKDLKRNLYKIWNRMSSGSYFPPPVRLVEIPKDNGGTRPLGVPTVADRVCQTVVKMVLEPLVEPVFHPDSYGYRPGKSALDAVGTARKRCWDTAWVIDLDIRSFFDSLNHELVERAVAYHTDSPWVRLYIARWLRAPVQRPDGSLEQRTRGTPQGGVVSPLLANLFLHDAFDSWMQRHFPGVRFERYADDAIVHCRTEQEARGYWMLSGVASCSAVWSFIRRRLGSSSARKTAGLGNMRISRSISWGTPSNLVGPRIAGASSLSASSRPLARRPPRRFGPPFVSGAWPPPGTTRAWRTLHNSSTPRYVAG